MDAYDERHNYSIKYFHEVLNILLEEEETSF